MTYWMLVLWKSGLPPIALPTMIVLFMDIVTIAIPQRSQNNYLKLLDID